MSDISIVEQKVKMVFGAVFRIDADKVNLKATPDTINNWDSLRHMNFILALEEEFTIMFSDDEIVAMHSLVIVVDTIKMKIS
jgi:acyl carrier protein